MSAAIGPNERPARAPVRLREAHVINLAARPERWAHFRHHVQEELGWPLRLHRFDAIDTRTWTTEVTGDGRGSFVPYVAPAALPTIAQNFRTEHQQLSRGAVGCALSHISLWNWLRNHKEAQTLLVFEDDAAWWPAEKMPLSALEALVQAIPNDWDLLTLGCIPREVIAEHEGYVHLGFFHQLHAYVLHRDGAEKLCGQLFPLEQQIDTVVSGRVKTAGLVCYGLRPNLFDQMWRRSPDFGTDCQTRMVGTPSRAY